MGTLTSKKIIKPGIIKREIAEPAFRKAPEISRINFLNKYYKKLTDAHAPERQSIILSRRIDEGVSKDYRNNGIVAGNRNGRFSTFWLDEKGREFNNHWDAKKLGTGKITRISDARGQLSVLSSAIDSYDYYPDVRKILLRYTSNPSKNYEFINVTQRRKNDLDNAASKGRFVQYVLRKYNNKNG